MYAAVISSEYSSIRRDVESFLDGGDSTLIQSRLSALEETGVQSGITATFGAEIECFFIPDSSLSSNMDSVPPPASLYNQIIDSVPAPRDKSIKEFSKGAVITPNMTAHPIMLNPGGGPTDIDEAPPNLIEIRTSPAGSSVALERYWDVLLSIGKVARENGLLGVVLSTHLNSALIEVDGDIEELYPLCEYRNSTNSLSYAFVANLYKSLVAIHPLQIEAGISPGLSVLQGLPENKNAPIAIHQTRLEYRHPSVGVIDPRLDMLATMASLDKAYEGITPASVRKTVRPAMSIEAYQYAVPEPSDEPEAFSAVVSHFATIDKITRRLIAPAQIDLESLHYNRHYLADSAVSTLTGNPDAVFAGNEHVIRELIQHCSIDEHGVITVDDAYEHKAMIQEALEPVQFIEGETLPMTETYVTIDTDESVFNKRRQIRKSKTLRDIFGSAINGITTPEVARDRLRILKVGHLVEFD